MHGIVEAFQSSIGVCVCNYANNLFFSILLLEHRAYSFSDSTALSFVYVFFQERVSWTAFQSWVKLSTSDFCLLSSSDHRPEPLLSGCHAVSSPKFYINSWNLVVHSQCSSFVQKDGLNSLNSWAARNSVKFVNFLRLFCYYFE
jgi:hypothetical protein